MLQYIISAIPIGFAFLVIYGALSDLSTFKIPNWVSYTLIGLFALHTFLVWLNTPFLPSLEFRFPPWFFNVVIGLITFVVAVVFWKLRYIGGGDVKYLTATTLWMGAASTPTFIVILTALAIAMVIILKLLANWGFLIHGTRLPTFVKRLFAKVATNELPYGFPIGIAALIMIPRIFPAWS
jgi:prepilin peptidase CpaA